MPWDWAGGGQHAILVLHVDGLAISMFRVQSATIPSWTITVQYDGNGDDLIELHGAAVRVQMVLGRGSSTRLCRRIRRKGPTACLPLLQ